MTRKTASSKLIAIALPVLLVLSCSSARVPMPRYPDFVASRSNIVPTTVLEIYGGYTAKASSKSFRSRFNLLLAPGKNAYLELLDPSGRLQNALSLDPKEISLLWAAEEDYVQEEATPASLYEITGLSLSPDDALMLISGYGLNFGEWTVKENRKDGWKLVRGPFEAHLKMETEISRMSIKGPGSEVRIRYEDYRMIDNRLIPRTIIFEVPKNKITVEWRIEKYIARDESPTPGLFALQLSSSSRRLLLRDLYRGTPLLLQ